MKKKTKILTLCIIVLVGVLIVVANVWRNSSNVRDIRVEIDYQDCDTLITPGQVSEIISEAIPQLRSTKLSDVDLSAVEKAASKSPYLYHCEAGTSIGGSVVLYGVQRRPIVRVMIGANEYYLDDQGMRVPVSRTGSCNVIVAGGVIPDKGKGQEEVWRLAKYLDNHPDLAPLFDQIYRDAKGDLYLTPKLGSHVIQVGSPENLDNKFRNLMVFYKQGLPRMGWDTYSQVSIKYRDQVVGTRRN